MKPSFFLKTLGLVIFLSIFCLSAAISFSAEASSNKTAMKDVGEKAGDTYNAIKAYSVERRQEAIKYIKTAIDKLDQRIDRLEESIDRDWDKMDAAAREKARATMSELRKERTDLAEWFGGLKHSSANGWSSVKKGVSASYDKLHSAFEKAEKDFFPDKSSGPAEGGKTTQ